MIGTVAWTKDLTGLISIDLKKAFDTVDHEILCQNSSIMELWVRNYREPEALSLIAFLEYDAEEIY